MRNILTASTVIATLILGLLSQAQADSGTVTFIGSDVSGGRQCLFWVINGSWFGVQRSDPALEDVQLAINLSKRDGTSIDYVPGGSACGTTSITWIGH